MTKTPNISRNDFVKGVVGMLGGIMGVVVGIPAIGFVTGSGVEEKPQQRPGSRQDH